MTTRVAAAAVVLGVVLASCSGAATPEAEPPSTPTTPSTPSGTAGSAEPTAEPTREPQVLPPTPPLRRPALLARHLDDAGRGGGGDLAQLGERGRGHADPDDPSVVGVRRSSDLDRPPAGAETVREVERDESAGCLEGDGGQRHRRPGS